MRTTLNRERPAEISSPSATSTGVRTKAPFKYVPLVLPKSSIKKLLSVLVRRQWTEELNSSSGIEMVQPVERPMVTKLSTGQIFPPSSLSLADFNPRRNLEEVDPLLESLGAADLLDRAGATSANGCGATSFTLFSLGCLT